MTRGYHIKQRGSQKPTFSLGCPVPISYPTRCLAWVEEELSIHCGRGHTTEPRGPGWPGNALLPPPLLLSHSLHYQILELLHTWGGKKNQCCNINLPRKFAQKYRLQVSNAGGMSSIPGGGTKIPYVILHGLKKKQLPRTSTIHFL